MFDVKKEVEKLEESLIALRRDFHLHPELGYKEFETSAKIRTFLEEIGAEEIQSVTGTGLTALIRGTGSGKTVMLRADMDALPVTEETGLPFASQNPGVMHACGHDGHMAIQLTAAKILAEHRDSFQGTVKVLFQPNEEEAGALNMIKEGVLKDPKVDAAFALHLWSPIPTGRIGLSPGPILGTTEEFELEIRGKAGHTAQPQESVDALLGACEVVNAVQTLVTREYNPMNPMAICFGYINGGTGRNIIADKVNLGGTIRFLFPDEEIWKPRILQSFERVIRNTCQAYRLDYRLRFIPSNPSLVNDARMTEIVKKSVQETYGTTEVLDDFKSLAGEDFAEFTHRVPSVMTWVGIADSEKGTDYPHHNSHFDIDEDMLKVGVEIQVRNVLNFLNGGQE